VRSAELQVVIPVFFNFFRFFYDFSRFLFHVSAFFSALPDCKMPEDAVYYQD